MTGRVGFPLANTILSNTATVITIEPGDPVSDYRQTPWRRLTDEDRQFDYIISDSVGSRGVAPNSRRSMLLYRDVIAASPGSSECEPCGRWRHGISAIHSSQRSDPGPWRSTSSAVGPWSEDNEVLVSRAESQRRRSRLGALRDHPRHSICRWARGHWR